MNHITSPSRVCRPASRTAEDGRHRGLLLDLLATHDTDGVTEAFELFPQLGEGYRAC